MIVPMKKVSFVVMDKDRVRSLEKLREAGVVHLERRPVSSDELSKLVDRKGKGDSSIGALRNYKLNKNGSGSDDKPEDLIRTVLDLMEERKSLQEQTSTLLREQTRIVKWGDFNPEGFQELSDQGLTLIPYELPVELVGSLSSDISIIVLEATKTTVRLLSVGQEIPGELAFMLPSASLSAIQAEVELIATRLAEIDKTLNNYAYQTGRITDELQVLQEQIEFETARAGMELVESADVESAIIPSQVLQLSWITGFVPDAELGLVKKVAADNSWAVLATDPGPDDNVPIKLRNNRFASIIYPLTDFLEISPGYDEADISFFFLLYFAIFFGMIFGDAGYGAILTLICLIGTMKAKSKNARGFLKLGLLLGISNLIWGTVTCSWFGIDNPALIPAFLQKISVPGLSSLTAAASPMGALRVQQNLMTFCFTLAVTQLSIGHIVTIVRTRSLKILGEIGAIAMLVGMYFIVLSLITSNDYKRIPMSMNAVYLFFSGFVLNFLFINYEGSFCGSILESVKNIIGVILGIANTFGDIMSYIRLWAVGLAGSAISSTVNSMAGPMLGSLLFFVFGVVLLAFGHGLNLIMNLLSVLVHGVRLNTLEFSSHVGLSWSGTPYRPFAEKGKQ